MRRTETNYELDPSDFEPDNEKINKSLERVKIDLEEMINDTLTTIELTQIKQWIKEALRNNLYLAEKRKNQRKEIQIALDDIKTQPDAEALFRFFEYYGVDLQFYEQMGASRNLKLNASMIKKREEMTHP
mgnify:CR=1 FL=1